MGSKLIVQVIHLCQLVNAYSESPHPTLAMASCGIGGHWGVDQW